VRPSAPQPLQGLAELFSHLKDPAKLAATLGALIPAVADPTRSRELKLQRAQALLAAGDHAQVRQGGEPARQNEHRSARAHVCSYLDT